ncbi:MAG: FtsX-like permease family protein [Clostridiales bacterium]|nr:FtsX-like permease family protein [Clostridiales bacterium]
MSIINLIISAFNSIKSRKVRVFLTMFGIIIGISSVVTIVSVGDGLKQQVSNMMSETNSNKYTISFSAKNYEDGNLIEYFKQTDVDDISKVNGVDSASKSSSNTGGIFSFFEISYFEKSTYIYLDAYEDNEINIEYGRKINNNDYGKRVIVLNKDAAKELFGNSNEAVGSGINLNGEIYEVIGISNSNSSGLLSVGYSYISKDNLKNMDTNDSITSIDFYLKPGLDANEIFEEINEILKLNHPELIGEGEYILEDSQQVTKAFDSIISYLTIFIACISGISLFVGGVGVMNIMYVSVSERKREIGIRRAIGARAKTILSQFLFEAIIITGLGGLIGILVGFGFSKILDIFLPFKTVLSISNFAISSIISVMVGLIFGIIPAMNAAKMEPIEAIYK